MKTKAPFIAAAGLLFLAGAILLFYSGSPDHDKPGPHHPDKTPTGAEAFHGLIDYRAQDAKKAILEPEFVPADKARLAGGTSVIGVSIDGESRAYPLYILNNHQIVNDTVGNRSIACSW
jgi:hypothetical protein|tara:strand:- start:104 stop:460 length:357 start_codon:yes stop_codon:yes gene_type:complete